jgi:phosphatidylglycerol lysyltransferase
VREGGRPTAFLTLLLTDRTDEAIVDLMRRASGCNPCTMDFLFVRSMLHLKAAGYGWFGLGIAPLSGMEAHPLAPLWHRLGRLAYRHGGRFYNFAGLRAFKQKFDPVWLPRYLATPSGIAPAFVISDAALLIGGGLKGLVAK